jgi:hypothetical protein
LGAARAALRLLEDRATRSAGFWPEFAEYDCFACHHALREPRPRPAAPGGLPWGTWYFSMPRALASLQVLGGRRGLLPLFDALEQEMARPSPNPKAVRQQASALRDQLTAWQGQVQGAPGSAREAADLLFLMAWQERKSAAPTWAGAEQLYLACEVLDRSARDPRRKRVPREEAIRKALEAMGRDLAFPAGQDGPDSFGVPAAFAKDRQVLRRQLVP